MEVGIIVSMVYQVADMILEFHGDPPLEESPLWVPFRFRGEQEADYKICRQYVPQLPACSQGHYFYDGVKERNYAYTLEEGKCLTIYALEDSMPWGQKIHQLYTELALPHVLLHKERMILHASYIRHGDRGIVFTAPSGTGKSTQADLWCKFRGSQILNGDRAVIGLRGDVPYAFGFPMSGSSPYCDNCSLPLSCVVVLKQAPENRIRRLKGREALKALLNGTYSDPKHPGDLLRNTDTALKLLSTPVFELSCRPDLGAVEVLEEAIAQASASIL